MPTDAPSVPVPALADRLGYLLKHAQLRLAGLTAAALDPLGISGRECAVLIAIDAESAPPSQQEAADRMQIDRTTMVALIDGLEAKGLLERRRDPADRRRNVIALTRVGRKTLSRAVAATEAAEDAALAGLADDERGRLRDALRALAFARA